MKKILTTTSAVLALVVLAGAGYFFFTNSSQILPPVTPGQATTTSTLPPPFVREVPAGAKEFRSDPHHFSVLYPENLTVKREDARGNATTFIFQNVKTTEGFQIYIIPYQEAQVSEAQFKKDIPSGIRNELKNISVDGVVGASFYSKDTALGETREVWFVRQGWLYEVTTLKPLEPWFNQILETWKFF